MATLGVHTQETGVYWMALICVIMTSVLPLGSSAHTGHGHRLAERSVDSAEDNSYEFSGQLDLVTVMDISQSVGPETFQIEVKDFMEHLIKTAIIINSDYTRLAAITFASEINTVIDSISGGKSFTGCEMFAPGGPWEQVNFIGGASGSDIMGALYRARQIFNIGRVARPGVKQVLFILSDAESFDRNSQIYAGHLKEEGVTVYGVGVGFYLRMDNLKNLTSQPWPMYCQTYGAWMGQLRQGNVRHKDGADEWLSVDLCPGCGEGATCYCSALYDFPPTCYCEAGLEPDQQGGCQGCASGQYKAAFGNHSCLSCPASTSDHAVRELCPVPSMSVGIQAAIAVGILLVLVCCIVAIPCVIRLRSRAKQKGTQCDIPSTAYTQTYATSTSATAACDIVNDVIRSQSQTVGGYMRSMSNADSGISSTGSVGVNTTSNPVLTQIGPCPSSDSDSEDYVNKEVIEKLHHHYESTKSRHRDDRRGKRPKYGNTFNMFRGWGIHTKKSNGSTPKSRHKVRSIISMFEKRADGKSVASGSSYQDMPEPYCYAEHDYGDSGGYTPLDIAISPTTTGPSFDNHGYLSPHPHGGTPSSIQMTRSLAYITRTLEAAESDRDYLSVSGASSRSSGPYLEILESPVA